MSESISCHELTPALLTRELAEKYAKRLGALANLIPGVDYTSDDILTEQKGDRRMPNKWDHSMIILGQIGEPIAFIMGYERIAEGNEQYPSNTLYISELAVAESCQGRGIARNLLRDFLTKNNVVGFLSLEGELNYSIQTNSAGWNAHVVDLYKSFGFSERAIKEYPNRIDVVLGVKASELALS